MALVDINKYLYGEDIPKNIYKERFLSLRARGLLYTIRSLPDDYKISLEKLQLLCKEKPYTIQKTLTELKNNGFISVKKLLPNETQSGRIEWIWSLNRNQKEEE